MLVPFKISPGLCSISAEGWCARGGDGRGRRGSGRGALGVEPGERGWGGSAAGIAAPVRAHCRAPPPRPIRLPAVQGEQLGAMALTGFSVRSPSGRPGSLLGGAAPCCVFQQAGTSALGV